MYPIDTYEITPNLFGHKRWQAEMDNQPVPFTRRAYSPERASLKLAWDIELYWQGKPSIMQEVVLPLMIPLRRLHDRLCRRRYR